MLFDHGRQRIVPVTLYAPTGGVSIGPLPLAVISPGYGEKLGAYEFLASHLVSEGYVVAAIQHDLAGDAPPATEGNLAVLRRPIWERGAANIRFVAAQLRLKGVASGDKLTLVGHSQGGDISMLLAETHPEEIATVFALDNRRKPIPRIPLVNLCSVRSRDLPADPGVLPNSSEGAGMNLHIYSSDIDHADMTGAATAQERKTLVATLNACLDHAPR